LHSIAWLFASRIGAGIACATIPVAQAYIADTTTLENRAKGMALIGAAFGVGFCFGPLIGAAAILLSPGSVESSPWPGFAAAGLSALAFLLALIRLPESLRPGSKTAAHQVFDVGAWGNAFATPTVPGLLLTSFVSVLSFGGFETTLALLLKEAPSTAQSTGLRHESLFHFTDWQVLLFFSYIGVVLSIAQGGIVRRLAGKVSEGALATTGAIFSVTGFGLLVLSVQQANLPLLMVASGVEVMGFAFMTPSLQSLISRRSDPARQGSIAGVSQSVSALARIAGPLVALPLFAWQPTLPYLFSAGLMLLGLVVMQFAVRSGKDHQ
jgi:MFS family permease